MDAKENNPRRRRFQFGLASLFVVITGLSIAFAFPGFVLGWMALALAAVIALIVFLVAVQFPVYLLMQLIAGDREDRTTDEDHAD